VLKEKHGRTIKSQLEQSPIIIAKAQTKEKGKTNSELSGCMNK
jgi:hypothetical protein